MRKQIFLLGLAGAAALAACGDEEPTGVGAPLVGPSITTFEVVLDPAEFLQVDTTYDNIGSLREVQQWRIIANDFAGELDAHTLFSIVRPYTVTYTPSEGGSAQTDSLLAIRGAQLTLVFDTIASTDAPVELEVLPVTESWDGGSVTWTLRYDTAGVAAPWTTPGGTTGPAVASAVWSAGDTLVIPIDSASAAIWQDTTAARMGALIRPTTPGSRLRIETLSFAFDVVPEEEPDTVLTAGSAGRSMHIVSSEPTVPPREELRVGGAPSWRTLLRFADLRGLVLDACGSGGIGTGDPDCDVPLQGATLTLAELILTPVAVGPRRIETPIGINGWQVLTTENVAIFRAPLGGPVGATTDTIRPALFEPVPPAGENVAVPITSFIRQLTRPADPEQPTSEWLALVSTLERQTFGYAAFASSETTTPPLLRLVVTIPNQEIFQ